MKRKIKRLIAVILGMAVAGVCGWAVGFSFAEAEEITPVIESAPQAVIMAEIEAEPTCDGIPYRYIVNCPLDKEMQQGIFDICEKYNVPFEFVMAVIDKESRFDVNAVGDGGDSVGLMQIQEKWHYELMADLGVTNLYNPLENVEVGVCLINEYLEERNGVYYALMKYNGGAAYADRMTAAGMVSDYAIEVTETAVEYEVTTEM